MLSADDQKSAEVHFQYKSTALPLQLPAPQEVHPLSAQAVTGVGIHAITSMPNCLLIQPAEELMVIRRIVKESLKNRN
jgi:hypothetical protein